MGILEQIVEHKRAEVVERKRELPLRVLQAELQGAALRDFDAALRRSGVSAIAEFKRRSPSKGVLREDADIGQIAATYANWGARAMSVLTDGRFFGGSAEDLQPARVYSGLPVLRKDFIVDEYQIHESLFIGADAILLIARVLDDAQLRDYHATAKGIGLDVLVEVHDERELERAALCGAEIIGVNNRNLDTFEVSLETSLGLRLRIPGGCVAVAESGIHTRDDVQRLEHAGFDAILVGESLMKADDPGRMLAELLGRSS